MQQRLPLRGSLHAFAKEFVIGNCRDAPQGEDSVSTDSLASDAHILLLYESRLPEFIALRRFVIFHHFTPQYSRGKHYVQIPARRPLT